MYTLQRPESQALSKNSNRQEFDEPRFTDGRSELSNSAQAN